MASAFEKDPANDEDLHVVPMDGADSIELAEIKSEKKDVHEEEEEGEERDVWAINFDADDDFKKWSDRSFEEKVGVITINATKCILALGFLYIFICSISMLGDSFQILAGKTAGEIFSNDSFLSNALTGLLIGILVTVLVQSSSTSTSIIITMVAAGILNVEVAIPMIMGTNVGTSVTNTLVSLTQSMDRNQFRRAFAGATVHDIFNLLSVLVFLPLEVISGYLFYLTKAIVDSFDIQQGSDAPDFLKVITDPVVKGIVQINKTVITLVAQEIEIEPNASMIKIWCEVEKGYINVTELYNKTVTEAPVTAGTQPPTDVIEATTFYEQEVQVGVRLCQSPEDFLFANTGLSDVEAGVILLIVSLFVLCFCLLGLVKILSSMLKGSVSVIIKKVINSNFKRPFGWVTGYLAILVGAGLTFLVQSSSVFTSTLTPLVGIGVISLKRMYPLSLGANIGTTTTGILTALANEPERLDQSLQLALVHLFFNLSGLCLWYPIPFMRAVPLKGAKALGNTTANYRWFAVLYLICVFFLIPTILIALSVADFWAMMSVVIVVLVTVVFVTIVNVLQSRKPNVLPKILRTWDFLPIWLRSLQPYDKFMTKVLLCKCCTKPKDNTNDEESVISSTSDSNGSTNAAYVGNDETHKSPQVAAL